jgi:eukaryotic-like serine/threonine-protein kinase
MRGSIEPREADLRGSSRIGTTLLGKWRIERLLGSGGMASVYVGVHKIGRPQAIKILHPHAAQSRLLRDRFEREARAANRLRHPGAVQILDIDTAEDGTPFLVMELVEGQTLKALDRSLGGIALDDLLRWVDELLDVLAAAHALGIVHRDIKPDNLLVQRDGRLKVLDFGIARMRVTGPGGFRTDTGVSLGTMGYMSPEQARGAEVDGRSDLFAVGATMFSLIARRSLHEAESDAEFLLKTVTEPVTPLALAAPGAPREVAAVVDRALALDRAARFPDAKAMRREVRRARKLLPSPREAPTGPAALRSPPPPRPSSTPIAPRRRGRAVARVLLLVFGVLVALGDALFLAQQIALAARRSDRPDGWLLVASSTLLAIFSLLLASKYKADV